ncbi:MAG: HAD hydrolase family protein [Deltaproteobacteria bacterium]|jgi:3-deoxy-D-manno-octulosonate 8-phosphate phosphatase (KDO 8-P phosphatase)|nr:HAD hydrolase family protein [Deltaproteobacteria bacterium]
MKASARPSQVSEIKWLGLDVDGVMTDGGIIIDDEGRESKRFHSRDGHGLKMLLRAGFKCALITGRRSRVVELRAKDLGITEVYQGVFDKLAVYREILARYGLKESQTAFAGDDIVDLPVLVRCGLAMAPADACPEVLAAAHFVAPAKGGRGAVRQMAEYILKGQGLWDELLSRYSS